MWIFLRWESEGYFKPNLEKDAKPFVIAMPPPNVTGALHMGHAMFVTLEVRELCVCWLLRLNAQQSVVKREWLLC